MDKWLVLFYDALRAHMKSEVLQEFMNHKVTVVVVLTHLSNKLQPLDVCIFLPFICNVKCFKRRENEMIVQGIIASHNLAQILLALKYAYVASLTLSNTSSGF